MNLRWLSLDYVDPELPLTRRQRRSVWHAAQSVAWRDMSWHRSKGRIVTTELNSRRSLAIAQALTPALFMFVSTVVPMLIFPWRIIVKIFALALGAMCMWAAITFIGKMVWKPHINKALREMGYDVCLGCGYWLRGLGESSTKCPECGGEREPMADLVLPAQPERR